LTVVGPEVPLCDGIVDYFKATGLVDKGHLIFGPEEKAAMLEGDKAFARKFIVTNNIPTPFFEIFSDFSAASKYLNGLDENKPIVVKASGLAAGKGAIVCENRNQAQKALEEMMKGKAFGKAGDNVVIEEFMKGEEASIFAVCDGDRAVYFPSAQDHKRAFDGDKGPNTGGMGAYSPAPVVTDDILRIVDETIVKRTLEGMKKLGTPYKGCLYVGLMIENNNPRVVEFNCRFGDPEIQAVLPLLKTDIFQVLYAAAAGDLSKVKIENKHGAACCVVLASGGYPGSYAKGKVISGLENEISSGYIFHAGTKRESNGQIVTNGGRVLNVVGVGNDIRVAKDNAYEIADGINFEGKMYRTDIAHRALNR
jgi:phosphoribosylamine--glycine ligase